MQRVVRESKRKKNPGSIKLQYHKRKQCRDCNFGNSVSKENPQESVERNN